jgi:hypothetical protein
MALHRGIQSAVFFYLSCAPCTGYSYRKKRRKEADRDRAAKMALEMEQPGLYCHPSPFATNVHWQTEIKLGPSPNPGKRRNGMKKARVRTSDENASHLASSVNLGLTQAESNAATWDWQRHDDDDDDDDNYWGSTYSRRNSRRPSTNAASTISRPLTAHTATTDRSGAASYYSASNPPINDLHPPIVTRIDTRADAMWMLQPPPPARIIQGRQQKPNLTRSDSGASRPTSRRLTNDQNLSRQVSQRIVDDKLRNGLSPSKDSLLHPPMIIMDPSSLSSSSSSSTSDDLKSRQQRQRRRPPPINVQEDTNPPPRSLVPLEPSKSLPSINYTPAKYLHLPSHPLSPVASASSDRSRSRSQPGLRNSSAEDRRTSSSNDNVLQNLVPTNSLRNAQARLPLPTKTPSAFESRIELQPTADQYEEMMLLGSGKAGFDSWYEEKDFTTFPQWAADRVRRDVTTRWSVDF